MDVKISEIDINQIIGVALGLCLIYGVSLSYKAIKAAISRILEARRLLNWMVKFAAANGFKDTSTIDDDETIAVKQPAMIACEMVENVVNAPPQPAEPANDQQTKRIPYNIKRDKKIPPVEKEPINFTRIDKNFGEKS